MERSQAIPPATLDKIMSALNTFGIHVVDADGRHRLLSEDEIIDTARMILDKRAFLPTQLTSPATMRAMCVMRLGALEHEVFGVIFLNTNLRMIAFEEMFRGTVASVSVHPREVVKRALALNASAVVVCHNHPSSDVPEPSPQDIAVTELLKSALDLVEIRLVDHIIVGGGRARSMQEMGLL